MQELLVCLLKAAEKAACIARACRHEEALFQLLVEEKTGAEKNAKFEQDFKTLADVLIQEMVRHEVGKTFPELKSSILGEESNKFTNKLGNSLTVEVKDTLEETKELLVKVLDNNEAAAKLLAVQVHAEVSLDSTTFEGEACDLDCNLSDLAVWIDPIDATSQYIKGGEGYEEEGLPTKGLPVVTVLLGAFLKSSGLPVLGVVNQPFATGASSMHWAVKSSGRGWVHSSSLLSPPDSRLPPLLLVGSSESPQLLERLSHDWRVVRAGGAGHKLLMVSLGLADVYVNTGPSTFEWDTCAPHALLAATGGGLLDCKGEEIKYSTKKETAANSEGVIAYKAGMKDEALKLISSQIKV